MNLAYNALLDGQRLEDIELRRNDEAFLDGLGAQRIPDPTTSGDFTRRFDQDSLLSLMEAINATRQQVWKKQPPDFLSQAFIDTDGTIAGTLGECKGGMALSYKGIWGYVPLIITLANTREVLYLVNRPGNAVSHEGCVWYGLLMPNRQRGLELLGTEFRRFQHLIVMLPAQIVRSGRRIIYRIMGYNDWLKDFFATWEFLRRMAPA